MVADHNQMLVGNSVSAGFPSPAEDSIDKTLDLHELMVTHPVATFFVRVQGHSMSNAGILENDILVVDRSLQAKSGDVVIAVVDGDFTVKYIDIERNKANLIPAHQDFSAITVTEDCDFQIWGVVTGVVRQLKKS